MHMYMCICVYKSLIQLVSIMAHPICQDQGDPHLEANSSDDSVRILGLAEQVLGSVDTRHPENGTETSGNLSISVNI